MTENTIPEHEIRLANNCYKFRILECERQTSKKGNPMLFQVFEIIENGPYTQDGETLDINGVKIMNWAILSDKAIGVVNAQRDSFGLPKVSVKDLDNINPLDYKGAEGYAYAVSESEEMRNDVTGEPVLNPYTKKPEVTWRKKITRYPSRPRE
jgi:hypothetical protein